MVRDYLCEVSAGVAKNMANEKLDRDSVRKARKLHDEINDIKCVAKKEQLKN